MQRSLRSVLAEKGEAAFSGRIDVDIAGSLAGTVGTVYFADGIVLEAKLGNTFGEPALWRMLLPEKLTIAVEAGRPRSTSGRVLGKPQALLERFDERLAVLSVYAEKVGGFDRVWAIRFDALAAVLEELPDAINPVLRLLDGKRTVRQVITACPLDDMLALRILAKLLAKGILVLPDDVVQNTSEQTGVVDVDEGLEAALAASLAEIEAEDAAAIPLTTRRPTEAPSSASAPPTTLPRTAPTAAPASTTAPTTSAASSVPPESVPPGEMPAPASMAPASTPASTSPTPAVTPNPTVELPANVTIAPAKPGLNDTLVEYDVPRAVTMAPDDSATLPIVLGLPSAPPVQTQADLRSWLGSEEAFFTKEPQHRTGDIVAAPRPSGLSPLWMVAILVAGAVIGALLTMKAC